MPKEDPLSLGQKIRAFAELGEVCKAWNIPGLSKQFILDAISFSGFTTCPTWDGEITDVVSGEDETDHGKNANAFPFHTDGVYYALPPHYVILYCAGVGGTGGETFFTPTKGVVDALRSEFDENLLTSIRVVYMERKGRKYRHPLIEKIDGGELLRWSSALYLEPDVRTLSERNRKRFALILPRLVAFINKTMAAQVAYRHTWHKGDLLVFDNHACVHGRTRIKDPDQGRHLYRVLFTAGEA